MNKDNVSFQLRRAKERGHADHGWLNSYHTFSFAGYRDPNHMGFRSLRVINDDTVAPSHGFDPHPHQEMEIISLVLKGALQHKDSMGHESVIRQGHVQRISAGTGIEHSEYNHSDTDPVHFLQIWIIPNERGVTPSYGELNPQDVPSHNGLKLIVSPDGADQSLQIHQDAKMFIGEMSADEMIDYAIAPQRGLWIHVIEGCLTTGDYTLTAGDALAVEQAERIQLSAEEETFFLLFDLA